MRTRSCCSTGSAIGWGLQSATGCIAPPSGHANLTQLGQAVDGAAQEAGLAFLGLLVATPWAAGHDRRVDTAQDTAVSPWPSSRYVIHSRAKQSPLPPRIVATVGGKAHRSWTLDQTRSR